MSGRAGGPLHRELSSAIVGVLGLGGIGRATAEHATAFGMRMLGCNRTVRNVPQLVEPLVYPLEVWAAMAAGCDYLLLIATLAMLMLIALCVAASQQQQQCDNTNTTTSCTVVDNSWIKIEKNIV